MLEITPDYKHNSPAKTAAGVDLASVRISPSRFLMRCNILIYSTMLLSASFAIFPFFRSAFYWPVLWLVFLLLIIVAMQSAWRVRRQPPVVLTVTQKIWRLQTQDGEIIVALCDDVLLWAGVIILPLREISTGRKHRIVALRDSMGADDWRRLSVWLRMALSKNI